jgi:hypothetical protein
MCGHFPFPDRAVAAPLASPTEVAPSPSEHAGLSLIECGGCGRSTYVKKGQTKCASCRAEPTDNWWARAYGGQKDPTPPQRIACRTCGTVRYGPRNVPGGKVSGCSRCLMQPRVSGKPGPVLAVTPLRAAVSANCANAAANDGCLMREDGCAVLRSQRCRHFEALAPLAGEGARFAYASLHRGEVRLGGPSRSLCPGCGDLRKPGHRFCDRCRKARRRTANRSNQQKRRLMSAVAP